MCDVGPRVGDVAAGLGEDALVVVAIEESVLDVALAAVLAAAGGAHAVRLEARLLEHDEQLARALLLRPGARGVGLRGEHVRVRYDGVRVMCLWLFLLVEAPACVLVLAVLRHFARLARR